MANWGFPIIDVGFIHTVEGNWSIGVDDAMIWCTTREASACTRRAKVVLDFL